MNFYLEMESAMGFVMPGICLSGTVKFPLASVRKSRHRQEDFPSHACTIDSCRKRPQVRAAVALVRFPLVVEPLSLDVGSTAKMSRCVSVEVQIVSIGCIGVNEEGMAIPIREKRLPPGDVCHSLGI